MGFGIGKIGKGIGKIGKGIGNIGKKVFSKRGAQAFLGSGGGLLPGVQEFMLTDKGNKIYEELHKGLGNLVTGGYFSQKEATEQAEKARDQAKRQYQEQVAAAEAEAARIANLESQRLKAEEERKKRLALFGTQNPPTLINSYLGVTEGRGTLG